MKASQLRDRRAFRAWNDAMVAKYDVDQFHAHPSPAVRWIEGERMRRLFALLAPRPADRVLDVGCGAGHLLARLSVGRPVGVDLSPVLLARAAAHLDGRATLIQADATELPFRTAAFERVYCSEVLEHLPDPRAAVLELRRVLRPRGIAVLSVPNEPLINRLKALLYRTRLFDLVMRTRRAGYAMPSRMDEEWHLHAFDLDRLRDVIPEGLRLTRVVGVPSRWLPLRYVVRCEAEG
jgi:SAM-dependent methyltransferase